MDGKLDTQILGFPGGNGGDMGGSPMWLLLGLLAGKGILGNNNVDGGGAAGISGYQAGVLAGNNFTKSDGFGLQTAITADATANAQNLAGTIISSANNTQNQSQANFQTLAFQTGGVKDAVQMGNYDNALLTKDTQNMIIADGNATRQLVTELDLQGQIRAKDDIIRQQDQALSSLNLNYALDSRGLLPASGPYMSVERPDHCAQHQSNQQIEIINQNVNAIGSTVAQLAGAVQGMLNTNTPS